MKSEKKITVVLPVLAPTPFLVAMTEFCIKTLRTHADNPFDLVVVEAEFNFFDSERRTLDPDVRPDRYLNFSPKIGGVKEINAGIRAVETEFVVSAGNDVIVPPHWDTELLRPFEMYKDCGVSALSAMEPGTVIGPGNNLPMIVEGMYSPFMMWRRGWEFDESYVRVYQDSDLILRLYAAGLRAYRNCNAHVHHLLRMTNDRVDMDAHNEQLRKDEELFYARWGTSPWMMFGLIRSAQWQFGKEHGSLLMKIPGTASDHPANLTRWHF